MNQICNVPLNIDDGILSLVKSSNYVMVELLLSSGQISIDTFQKCLIKEYGKNPNQHIYLEFIYRLIIFLDNISIDKIIVDTFLNAIINKTNRDSDILAPTINKLINMGGEIYLEHISMLPDDLFFEYVEYYEVEINFKFLFDCVLNSTDNITSWVTERFNFSNVEDLYDQMCRLICEILYVKKLNVLRLLIKRAYENHIGERIVFFIFYRDSFMYRYLITENIFSKEISFIMYAKHYPYEAIDECKCLHPDITKYDSALIKSMYETLNISLYDMKNQCYYDKVISIVANVVDML